MYQTINTLNIVAYPGFGVRHEGELLELLPNSGPAGRCAVDNSAVLQDVKQPQTSI